MSTPQISRRSVAKGIAWTAPAITIAATAPALAASGSEAPVLVTGSSWADKCQGESQISGGWSKQGYRIRLTVSPADAPAPPRRHGVQHVLGQPHLQFRRRRDAPRQDPHPPSLRRHVTRSR